MFTGFALRNFCTQSLHSVLLLTAATVLLPGSPSRAENLSGTSAAHLRTTHEVSIPAEYGEIVYQKNAHCPQQIFIIGQSHRSSLTGRPRPETVKVQAEIFRIGEWLIREKNVELLLPEGFFQRGPSRDVPTADLSRESIRPDTQSLEAALGDSRRFINADMLLNASYPIRLAQIEDEKLYRDIRHLLGEARQTGSLSVLSELDDLQDERTSTMLQNIPDVVEEAFRAGGIDNRRAMFTIGLAHVGEIIDYLRCGSLRPPSDGSEHMTGTARLKLLDQGYGVTVIIPRTLAENEQILRLCRLDSE